MVSITRLIKVILLIGLTGLSSCFGLFDSGSEKITDNYVLSWIDLQESQVIRKTSEDCPAGCEALTPDYIFSVGHNENFIIAKQHPTSGFEGGYEIDTSITNYFIIEINTSDVIGPLKINQFDSTVNKMGIKGIKFDLNYPEYY